MKSFIEETLDHLMKNSCDFSSTRFVLPGKRPIVFFKKEFQTRNFKGVLPSFCTIEELMEEISGLNMLGGLDLCFAFFEAYAKANPTKANFEDFLKWQSIALKDFDDIDANAKDPLDIFDYLSDIHQIERWGENSQSLEEQQKTLMYNQLNFWRELKSAYLVLNQDLSDKNLGYKGAVIRQAHKNINDFLKQNQTQFVFIGFNAFTVLEEKMIVQIIKNNSGEILFDSDPYYLDQDLQEAGFFLRKHKENPYFSKGFISESAKFIQEKNIGFVEVPNNVSQGKVAGVLLEDLTFQKENTALVLADELLLEPVLGGLTPEIDTINLTMGIPLGKQGISTLFQQVFDLHKNREKLGKNKAFYYKNILSLGKNLHLPTSYQNAMGGMISAIEKNNLLFLDGPWVQEKLQETPDFAALFSVFEKPSSLIEVLKKWSESLLETAKSELEKNALILFCELFESLHKKIIQHPDWIGSFKVLYLLYQGELSSQTLNSIGNPLSGLQILGILETRLLSFDNLIMTSVNEGVLPLGKKENTFIPFDVRKEKGLNTFVDNDAIYGYHFYRLVQRAKNIYFIYNTDTQGLGSGEKSRFLSQLEIESPHKIVTKIVQSSLLTTLESQKKIAQTKGGVLALKQYMEKGISASAIASFLGYPLDFYKRYVLGIKQDDLSVEENLSSQSIGTLTHLCLEELYTPLIGKTLVGSDLLKIEKEIEPMLEKHFINMVGTNTKGENHLQKMVVLSYLKKVVKQDLLTLQKGNELCIEKLEVSVSREFEHPNYTINLTGKIDRIDRLNGMYRLVDFKTGKVDSLEITKEEQNIFDNNKKGIFQLLFYGYLWAAEKPGQIISMSMFDLTKNQIERPLLILGEKEFSPKTIENLMQQLHTIIDQWMDPSHVFEEKIEEKFY
ncbi:MAG: hypothetical protein C4K58_01130 [Flavobacteriaceae bacterium]|nr:MAG: hypothetical protein C4K58_01130 [Flavobacteriaceae bacterium]